MSDYKYRTTLPATQGFGPCVEIRCEGELIGFVRRIAPESNSRASWMVYKLDGSEAGIADQRKTAANFLRGLSRTT